MGAIAHGGARYLTLACPRVEMVADGRGGLAGRLRLRAGDQRWIALTHADDPDRAEEALTPSGARSSSRAPSATGKTWAERCTYRGPLPGPGAA